MQINEIYQIIAKLLNYPLEGSIFTCIHNERNSKKTLFGAM